jgi:hypothetical protein
MFKNSHANPKYKKMRRKFKDTTKTLDSFIHNLLLKNYDPNNKEHQGIFK